MVGVGGGNHLCYRWLRTIKEEEEGDDEEEPTPYHQMFGVPATAMGNPPIDKTIILIIRLRTSCAGVLHKKKNRFVYDFFGHTFFLMDDVTKVLTVVKLEEKREVKLHKQIVK